MSHSAAAMKSQKTKRLKFSLKKMEQGWSPLCDNVAAGESEWAVTKAGCVNGPVFDPKENKKLSPDIQPLTDYLIRSGDVLMSRANTKDLLGSAALVREVPDRLLFCDKIYRLLPDPARMDSGFLVWALSSKQARVQMEQEATGASNSMQNIGQDTVRNLWLPDHPLSAQQAIAAYLDRETQRLDELLKAKENLLELLAEKRRALIARAVTRGLNPQAPLKETGIEWLGMIPNDWQTRRVKYLFTLIADAAPEDNEFELLALYTDIGVRPRKELEARGNNSTTTDNYWIVQPGDLVVNKLLAWMGAFGVSDYSGVTSPAYDILRGNNEVEPLYYHYLFRCGVCFPEFRRRSYGIMDMRLRLYFDRFGDMPVPLPPLQEQKAIIAHIATETAKLDALRASAERTIRLLKERRAALISAAVTGKIDLPPIPA